MPLDGLATDASGASSRARRVLAAPSRASELTMTLGRGFVVMISAVACSPSTRGILMSMVMTSGLSDSAMATASRPSLAFPTTCSSSSALKIRSRTFCMKMESSTISTRSFLVVVAIVRLRYRSDRAWRLRSHELFDRRDKLVLLHRLGQECRRTFLHRPVTVFRAGARSNHHHRNSSHRRALPQLNHQFVTGHARHFEVGDDQMAAVLRHEFSCFQSVGRQFHAISILLQHAAHELAHADGIGRHHNQAFLLYSVDR